MSFYKQFDEFDPLEGVAPSSPFSHLPDIVERARRLLKNRTREEIISAARSIDFFIEEYFVISKSDYIQHLLDTGGYELGYLAYEDRTEAGVRELLDNWPSWIEDSPPDIPTSENTSELEALVECIGNYKLDDTDFPDSQEFEYFAVLALWLVADAIAWLKWTSDPQTLTKALRKAFGPISFTAFPQLADGFNKAALESRDHVPELVATFDAAMQACKEIGINETFIRVSNAGSHALDAMDAVCYAEYLHASTTHNEELTNLRLQLDQAAQKTDILAEEKAKKKISVVASKAAVKRHTENRAMKEEVFVWCATQLDKQASMDAAAAMVAGKLVPIAFRTARSWIGEYRKKHPAARTL